MLSNQAIEDIINETGEVDFVQSLGDGYHYQLTVVSNVFLEKSKVARQQWVYSKLRDHITSGNLHAITMKTLTKAEWEKEHG